MRKNTMTLQWAEEQARKGIKVKHDFFMGDEFMLIEGDWAIFEDGSRVLLSEWLKDKDYLKDRWSLFVEK